MVETSAGKFQLAEGSASHVLESTCSVKIQNDPAQFDARHFNESQLEFYKSKARMNLQKELEKCSAGIDEGLFSQSCIDALTPWVKTVADVVKRGSSQACLQFHADLSACLDQIAEQERAEKNA